MPNQGYNHIALFTPLNASKPLWITKGEWEVTEISGVDTEKGLVYVFSFPRIYSPFSFFLFLSFSPQRFVTFMFFVMLIRPHDTVVILQPQPLLSTDTSTLSPYPSRPTIITKKEEKKAV